MNAELIMLGGAEEIGANCCYLNLDGTGIFVDAGLHPRDRTERAFPAVDLIGDREADVLLTTHAHTDHIGALPYVMRRFPHLRPIMTHATRDLSHVMLPNGARLLKTEISDHVPKEWLEFYHRDVIEQLRYAFEAIPYGEPLTFRGYNGRSDVKAAFHWSGHILGSAGISLANKGFSILHTGDVQFDHQTVIPKATLPRHHVDVLITEATNGALEEMPTIAEETKRLAAFINRISERNGSILIPCFALGKMQEMLALLYAMMRRGSIPYLPIHTGGMGTRISKIYDQYCYSDPMRRPGFEISDVPQEPIHRFDLDTGSYMKTPSIVLASSGMVNPGTISFNLAQRWMAKPKFGIAFIGFQHPTSPGYQLMNSKPKTPFDLAGARVSRTCEIERFRFSAHASREGLVSLAMDVRPSTVVIMHGEPEACDGLALEIRERLPGTRIIIPRLGVPYALNKEPEYLSV
ncbi:MAG: MBL fold metallo-hydrolase [Ignavibacteria bacterium]|nr:MBL fold metallo-hydrolase [Ignavibacteria bacterium]